VKVDKTKERLPEALGVTKEQEEKLRTIFESSSNISNNEFLANIIEGDLTEAEKYTALYQLGFNNSLVHLRADFGQAFKAIALLADSLGLFGNEVQDNKVH